MCGRYFFDGETQAEVVRIVGRVKGSHMEEHWGDICPSQAAPVLTGRSPGLLLEEMCWGFPEQQRKGLLINARCETVLERRMFRDSILQRRCVIPAKGFYEWNKDREKVVFSTEEPVLYMAGFYNWFQEEDRFIILTTAANASVSPVHDRMPLILDSAELQDWVYEDSSLEFFLRRPGPLLNHYQEYEQQSLF